MKPEREVTIMNTRRRVLKCGLYTVTALFMVPGWVLVKCGASREVALWVLRMHARAIRFLVLLPFGIKVRFIGEKLEGASIVVANHEGWIETVYMLEMTRNPSAWITKELLDFPFMGACHRRAGGIEIDKQDQSMAAGKKLLDLTKDALKKGRALYIFPEGGLGTPRKEIPYHLGVYLPYRFNPAVPLRVLVHNGSDCLERYAKDTRDLGTQPIPGTIYFVRLEDIPPGLGQKEFMDLLQSRIRTARRALIGMPSRLSDTEFMQELDRRIQQMSRQEVLHLTQAPSEPVAA